MRSGLHKQGGERENVTQPDRFFIKDTEEGSGSVKAIFVGRISSLILITSHWGFMVKAGGSLAEGQWGELGRKP